MIPYAEMLMRIALAFVLSGFVGLEREMRGHEAGLRTHIMVCVGSTLIMLTSLQLFDIYKAQGQVDPIRIAANVITGISFLGAGTIIRSQEGIRGLTTAATLWVVAALGLAIGSGFVQLSVSVAALILIVNVLLRKFEDRLIKK